MSWVTPISSLPLGDCTRQGSVAELSEGSRASRSSNHRGAHNTSKSCTQTGTLVPVRPAGNESDCEPKERRECEPNGGIQSQRCVFARALLSREAWWRQTLRGLHRSDSDRGRNEATATDARGNAGGRKRFRFRPRRPRVPRCSGWAWPRIVRHGVAWTSRLPQELLAHHNAVYRSESRHGGGVHEPYGEIEDLSCHRSQRYCRRREREREKANATSMARPTANLAPLRFLLVVHALRRYLHNRDQGCRKWPPEALAVCGLLAFLSLRQLCPADSASGTFQ